jgi:hypothetical protein
MTSIAADVVVTIIAEQALEVFLVRDLDHLGADGYTITDARGRGHRGVRGTTTAEGGNVRCEVVCSRALAIRILDHLRSTYDEHYAVTSFVTETVSLR